MGASHLSTVCHTEVIQQFPVLPGPVMTVGFTATGYRGFSGNRELLGRELPFTEKSSKPSLCGTRDSSYRTGRRLEESLANEATYCSLKIGYIETVQFWSSSETTEIHLLP